MHYCFPFRNKKIKKKDSGQLGCKFGNELHPNILMKYWKTFIFKLNMLLCHDYNRNSFLKILSEKTLHTADLYNK